MHQRHRHKPDRRKIVERVYHCIDRLNADTRLTPSPDHQNLPPIQRVVILFL
jgi:hypothetical protein